MTPENCSGTDERIKKLWEALLDTLLKYFRDTPQELRRASTLDVARKFIKDNGGITEPPEEAKARLTELATAVVFPFQ